MMDCSKCEVPGLPGGCHNKELICRKCRESARAERDAVRAEIETKRAPDKYSIRTKIGFELGITAAMKVCAAPISEREGGAVLKSKDRVKGYREGTEDWNAEYNMLLDDGITCNECVHIELCCAVFGQRPYVNNGRCQFYPNRFKTKGVQ